MRRWARRPRGSNWGDFGEDDQIGRLNLITAERRRAAAAEVRTGLAFPLSLPLDHPKGQYAQGPRRPPVLRSTALGHNHRFHAGSPDVVSDDYAEIHLQYSTQWDSFAHHGSLFDSDGTGNPWICYYNGYRAGIDVVGEPDGSITPHADALGIETIAQTCVQGRGVMVDLERAVGHRGTQVGHSLFQRILDEQGVVVEPGDVLCLHTGLTRLVLELGDDLTHDVIAAAAVLDAQDPDLLQWITDSGVSAIVADNLAIERFTLDRDPAAEYLLPLHTHCLFKQGIPLGEMWYLADLNAWLRENRRYRFLLTAPPLRLTGAVGSPVSGVATV